LLHGLFVGFDGGTWDILRAKLENRLKKMVDLQHAILGIAYRW
jgi:hypothetical protein